MKKYVITIILILSFSNVVNAATNSFTSTISHVYPHTNSANGDFIIMLRDSAGASTCPNLNTPKYYRVTQGQSGIAAPSSNKMYAATLAAAASNKSIRIQFNIVGTECYVESLWVIY